MEDWFVDYLDFERLKCVAFSYCIPGILMFKCSSSSSLSFSREDMYSQDSIDLLQNSGLQFKKHEEEGIDTLYFAELLMTSGLVLCENVKWLSFHRCVGLEASHAHKQTNNPFDGPLLRQRLVVSWRHCAICNLYYKHQDMKLYSRIWYEPV